jgi:hypothetical protein
LGVAVAGIPDFVCFGQGHLVSVRLVCFSLQEGLPPFSSSSDGSTTVPHWQGGGWQRPGWHGVRPQ